MTATKCHCAARTHARYPRESGGGIEKTRSVRPQKRMSFVPPSSGMFIWVTLYFSDVPAKTDERNGSVLTPEQQFWKRLADADVLVAPGWIFAPDTHVGGGAPPAEATRQIGHVRMSFTPSDVSADPCLSNIVD